MKPKSTFILLAALLVLAALVVNAHASLKKPAATRLKKPSMMEMNKAALSTIGIQPLMTKDVVRLPLLAGPKNGRKLAKANGWIQLTYDPVAKVTNIAGRVSNLEPNTVYRVFLWAPDKGFHHGEAFRTYDNGSGGFSDTVAGNHSHHIPAIISDVNARYSYLYSEHLGIG